MMASGVRSSVRGHSPYHGEGHGQDGAISFHESIYEEPIQDGNREGHVKELQEENHRE